VPAAKWGKEIASGRKFRVLYEKRRYGDLVQGKKRAARDGYVSQAYGWGETTPSQTKEEQGFASLAEAFCLGALVFIKASPSEERREREKMCNNARMGRGW